MELFPSIVSKARTIQVINHGAVSGHLGSGSLHLVTSSLVYLMDPFTFCLCKMWAIKWEGLIWLCGMDEQMQAEVEFPSPLVPAREVVFFRYCVHNSDEGTWSVVDFPAEGFQLEALQTSSVVKCQRRPSGCIIQDMPNGYSRVSNALVHVGMRAWLCLFSKGLDTLICLQVVWVEHVEMVGEEKPLHQVFKNYVANGTAFGATRWVSLLQRQCERLASELARNIADLGGMLLSLSLQAYFFRKTASILLDFLFLFAIAPHYLLIWLICCLRSGNPSFHFFKTIHHADPQKNWSSKKIKIMLSVWFWSCSCCLHYIAYQLRNLFPWG